VTEIDRSAEFAVDDPSHEPRKLRHARSVVEDQPPSRGEQLGNEPIRIGAQFGALLGADVALGIG
jgi:hypothetical protein